MTLRIKGKGTGKITAGGGEPEQKKKQSGWSRLHDFPRLWIWMTVVWMGVIFLLSTSYFSSERTDRLNLPFNIRFIAHIMVYFVLGFLVSGAIELNSKSGRKFLIALLFSVFYAFTDELHQHFEPARHGRGVDVLTDSVSAMFGIFVFRSVFLAGKVKRAAKPDFQK